MRAELMAFDGAACCGVSAVSQIHPPRVCRNGSGGGGGWRLAAVWRGARHSWSPAHITQLSLATLVACGALYACEMS